MQGSRGQSPFLGRAARNGLPKRSDAQRREFPGAGIRTEAPGGKVARVSSELHALPGGLAGSEVARNSPSPPFPRPVQTWQRPESKGSPRCVGGAGGVWRGPLTISTWRGSSWLGGAGTENWIFLRSLGSMAGVVAGGAGRALGSGSGATLPAGLARAGRGAEATAGWLVSGEEEGCVRTDKNTERGEGRAREEGSPPACPPPCPSCPRARPPSSNRSSVPSRLHPRAPRLAGLCVSASLCLPLLSLSVFKCHSSVSPPFPISHSFSPRLSLSLPLSPSLPVSPLWPSLGVPSPSPRLRLAPGA